MKEDLITKHRPRTFESFWTQSGPVEDIRELLRSGTMPVSIVLVGTYGTGKTSLAYLMGQSVACLRPNDCNPCYECDGCRLVDLRFMGYGSRLVIHGGRPNFEELRRFCWECSHCYAAFPDRHNVIVLDEAHELNSHQQAEILPLLESTNDATFVFCTTRSDQVDGAILARSHSFEMRLPTEQETARYLLQIACLEGISLSQLEATMIAAHCNGIPRDCLKELQRIRRNASGSR